MTHFERRPDDDRERNEGPGHALTRSDRNLGIGAAIAAISVVGIGLSLSMPLMSLLLETQGISETLIGLSTGTTGIAALIASPASPGLARRFGAAPAALGALVLAIVSLLAIYLWQNVWVWFPLRFLLTFALTVLFAMSEFWINALAPDKARGLVLGVYATVLSAGFAAGPAILSIVGTQGPLPFVIGVALFAAGLVPIVLAWHTAPSIMAGDTTRFLPFLVAVPLATSAAFVFGMAESTGFSLLPVYGTAVGMSDAAAINLVTFMALGGLIFHIPIGLVADKVDRRKLLAICGFMGAAGAALLPFIVDSTVLRSILLLVWGGIAAGLYTVGLADLGARFKGGALASANSAFIFMYALGMLLGPSTAGIAMEVWPPHGMAGMITAFFTGFVALAIWRIKRAAVTPATT